MSNNNIIKYYGNLEPETKKFEDFYDDFGRKKFTELRIRVNDKYLDMYYHAKKNKVRDYINPFTYDKKVALVLYKANYKISKLCYNSNFFNAIDIPNFFDSLIDVYEDNSILESYSLGIAKSKTLNMRNLKRMLPIIEKYYKTNKESSKIIKNLKRFKNDLKKADFKFPMSLGKLILDYSYIKDYSWIKELIDWNLDMIIENNLSLEESFFNNKTNDQIESFVDYMNTKGYSFDIFNIKDIKNVIFWEKLFKVVSREKIIESINFLSYIPSTYNSFFQSLTNDEIEIFINKSLEFGNNKIYFVINFWKKIINLKNEYKLTKHIIFSLKKKAYYDNFVINYLNKNDVLDYCEICNIEKLKNSIVDEYLNKFSWNPRLEKFINLYFYHYKLPAKYKIKYAIKYKDINIVNQCIDEKYYPSEKDVMININFLNNTSFKKLIMQTIAEEDMSNELKWIINIKTNKLIYKGLNNLDLINTEVKYGICSYIVLVNFNEIEKQINNTLKGYDKNFQNLLELDFIKYRAIILKSLHSIVSWDYVEKLHKKGFRLTIDDIKSMNATNWIYFKKYYKFIPID